MSGYYIESTTATNINDVFDGLSAALVSAGWTKTVINSDTSAASAGLAKREEHFTSPGTSSIAGGVHVGIVRMNRANGGSEALQFWCWLGEQYATVTTAARVGATVTVTTASPHGFTTGQVAGWNGTDDDTVNALDGANDSAGSTITVSSPTVFTVTRPAIGDATGNGGLCWVHHNPAGSRSAENSSGFRVNLNDAASNYYGFVDEFRLAVVVQQGGTNRIIYCGATERDEQTQEDGEDTAVSNDAITVGANTVTLDRTPSKMYVGQPLWVVSPDTADVEVTTITGLTGDQLSFTAANAYNAGAVVGWDPLPLCTAGLRGSATGSLTFSSYACQVSLALDGTRKGVALNDFTDAALEWDPSVEVIGVESATEAATDPSDQAYYTGRDVKLYKINEGFRGPMAGLVAFPKGTQNEYDIHRTGATAADTDFRVFTSNDVGAFFLAVGPGAE